MDLESLTYNLGKKKETLEYVNNVVNGKGSILKDIKIITRYSGLENYFSKWMGYVKALETLVKGGWSGEVMKDVDKKHSDDLKENLGECYKDFKDLGAYLFYQEKNEEGKLNPKEVFINKLNMIVNDLHHRKQNTYGERKSEIKKKIQSSLRGAKKVRNKMFKLLYNEHTDNSSSWESMKTLKRIAFGQDKKQNCRTYKDRFALLKRYLLEADNTKFTLNDLDELRAIKRYYEQNWYLNDKLKDKKRFDPELKGGLEDIKWQLGSIIKTRERLLAPTIKFSFEYPSPKSIDLSQTSLPQSA